MRWLYLIAFVCLYNVVNAQEKEIVISEKGVSNNIDKSDAINPAKERATIAQDSILGKLKSNKALDSLAMLQKMATGQVVFSQKQWRKLYDSLSKLPAVNIPSFPNDLKREVSEQELVDAVNKKFSSYNLNEDSISSNFSHSKDSIQNISRSQIPGLPKLPGEIPNVNDVSKLKLPGDALQNLIPTPASLIKTKYIKKLDSIRSINLSAGRLKLKENVVSQQEKISSFSKKPDFWDRSYFEGVVGFSPGNFKILQASPTIGYHFTDFFSLGLGPNLTVRQEAKSTIATVGLKGFMKIEFFKRKVYLQGEDIMDSYGIKTGGEGKQNIFNHHNLFVGGGYLLSLKAPITLNLSILYNLTENKLVSYEYAPFVFRIGLSSLKLKN